LKKGIVIAIALFLFFSVIQGCAKKPLSQTEQIIGTWLGVNKDVGNITFDKTGGINIFNEVIENKGTYSIPSANKLTITMKDPNTGQETPQTYGFVLEKDMFKIIVPEPTAGQEALPPLEFKRATEKDIADLEKKKVEGKKSMEEAVKDIEQSKKEATENYILFETTLGNIKLELYPDVAPRTVANFIKLVKDGFYNRIIFHRVIPDFMIQTGGTKEDGSAKEVGYKFEDEINPKALGLDDAEIQMNVQKGYVYSDTLKSIKLEYGILAMANAGPNTNGSQIFIITKKEGTEWLNGLHTAFGKVVEGMDVALKIQNVPRDKSDKPLANVVINLAKLVPKK
jgi:peptidyl-prolyl cis-trans isomerase B (cyclophilin B)